MRLRKVEGATDLINSHPEYIVNNIDNSTIDIKKYFDNEHPIHVELGMGKGQFIYTLAKQNPDINYIGVEMFDSVIVRALEKLIEEPLPNVLLVRTDASFLPQIFDIRFDRLYLNFSDPWPKERHAKRRLTNRRFLKLYKQFLTSNGEVHFKTDNRDLFDYSVEEVQEFGMEVTYLSYDLHQEDNDGNIMTEFEERYSKKGNKINKLIARFEEDQHG